MNEYETVYILEPDLPKARVDKIHDKVKKALAEHGGQVLHVHDWGKRKLSYRIGKYNFGHYFYYNYSAAGTLVAELERQLKLDEEVVRFLTVRIHGKAKQVEALEDARLKTDEGRSFHRDSDFGRDEFRHDNRDRGGDHAPKV